MKFWVSRDGIPPQESVTVSLARSVIGRKTLIFGMSDVLREDHLEGLRQYRKRRRFQCMGVAAVQGQTKAFLTTSLSFVIAQAFLGKYSVPVAHIKHVVVLAPCREYRIHL